MQNLTKKYLRKLFQAGVDTKIYGPHSVRSAVTSKANVNSVPLDVILKKQDGVEKRHLPSFITKKLLMRTILLMEFSDLRGGLIPHNLVSDILLHL